MTKEKMSADELVSAYREVCIKVHDLCVKAAPLDEVEPYAIERYELEHEILRLLLAGGAKNERTEHEN